MSERMDDAGFAIVREESPTCGRYVIWHSGGDSEMTYSLAIDGTLVIGHTYVPPKLRSKGLAETLVMRGVADARREGRRIRPLCSYVQAEFRRHPEWADLLGR